MTAPTRHIPQFLGLVLSLTLAAMVAGPATGERQDQGDTLRLNLRTRVEPFKGSGVWEEMTLAKDWSARETAVIICDMWDNHWCQNATKRCDALARKMAPVVDAARKRGVQIIHAPSECMNFYKDTPQRRRLLESPPVQPPKPLDLTEPPLPIDDSDGGCDDEQPAQQHRAWTREHAALTIADGDGISDSGAEIYSFFKNRGIKNVIMMGVHTNMCVLGRSFAIRQMTKWGLRCVLVRDLTDSMYNPKKAPFVTHEEGTERIVQHIEKYWCPSILSGDLIGKAEEKR
jgi:nicotinamidase-related amidase